MKKSIKTGTAFAISSILTSFFVCQFAFADATNINVESVAAYYNALQTIHASSSSEFTITLTKDITVNNASEVNNQAIDNGNTVTIIGNGHTLTFALGNSERLSVNNATLNLGKSDGSDTLIIKGAGASGWAQSSLVSTGDSATVNMYKGVELTENYAGSGALSGGGVRLGTNSTFNMYGGKIHHNGISDGGMGGAVAADSAGSVFHMYDGELSYNTLEGYWGSAAVAKSGGLVHIHGGTIANNTVTSGYGGTLATYDSGASTNPSSMIIENAVIKDNDNSGAYYGAILNYSGGGTITIKDSIIENNTAMYGAAIINDAGNSIVSQDSIYRNNTAAYYGGAVYTDGDFTSSNDQFYNNTATIGGGLVISGGTTSMPTAAVYNNHATTAANDYYISSSATSVSIIPAADMNGYATYGSTETNLENWYNDTSSDRFDINDPTAIVNPSSIAPGNEYSLTAAGRVVYTLHFETDGGSTIDDQKVITGTAPTAPADPTKANSTFEGWYTDTTYGTEYDFTAAMAANTTAYAKWTATPAPDPAPDPTPDPAPAPTPEPESLPDNPPTSDSITTYILLASTCSLGLAIAIKSRK